MDIKRAESQKLLLCLIFFPIVCCCETVEYVPVSINISYLSHSTDVLIQESLKNGKIFSGRSEPISGVVVHATGNDPASHDACDPLDKKTLPEEPFIALVKQGKCADQLKWVNVAINKRARAIVLYSDRDTVFLIQMEAIPFVMINRRQGEDLVSLLNNGTRVVMQIEPEPWEVEMCSGLNRTSIAYIAVTFVFLLLVSFAWLLFFYVQKFRYVQAKELISKRLCGAVKMALDKIPINTVKTEEKEPEKDCAICIEPFHQGELTRMLPCKHSFHKICIDPWLLENRSCPLCKLDILKHFGLTYSGSLESVLEIEEEEHSASYSGRRRSSVRVAVPRMDPPSRSQSLTITLCPQQIIPMPETEFEVCDLGREDDV